jgi:CHAD domain-containing protein
MSKTLVEYFNQNRRDAFQANLQQVKSLQEIADTIHDELASYADIEGNYIQSLTPSEAKTALALLSILRESNAGRTHLKMVQSQERYRWMDKRK